MDRPESPHQANKTQKTFLCNFHTAISHHPRIYWWGEGKAVPLQAWSGPEGSRKLRFPHFMLTAQDGGKVVSLMVLIGKAVPLQAWSGPEGSRKLRFADFMTTAQDGCKVVSLTHRPPLPPGNTPGTDFNYVEYHP